MLLAARACHGQRKDICALQTDHAAEIYFGFSQPTCPLYSTVLLPLSYLGAGGRSTGIFTLSNKIAPVVAVVARLLIGNVTLMLPVECTEPGAQPHALAQA